MTIYEENRLKQLDSKRDKWRLNRQEETEYQHLNDVYENEQEARQHPYAYY